jgi:hypothetical protein
LRNSPIHQSTDTFTGRENDFVGSRMNLMENNEMILEDEQYIPKVSVALERAEKENLNVNYPEENELFLDFDSSTDYEHFEQMRFILDEHWGVASQTETPSMSGRPGHIHMRVQLRIALTTMERLALQAMLGSDRKHELLSLAMYKAGEQRPTLFLEKLK